MRPEELANQLGAVLKQASQDHHQVTVQLEEQANTSAEVERLREVLRDAQSGCVTYHLSAQ